MMMIIALLIKIYLYSENPHEAKHHYFIKKREKNDLQNLKYLKAFIEYSNNMLEVYKNIEEYNPSRKSNVLIVLHHMISDMISYKKFSPIVTKLFIRGRKLNTFMFLLHNLISKYQKMQD